MAWAKLGVSIRVRYQTVRGRHLSWEENGRDPRTHEPIVQPDRVAVQCFWGPDTAELLGLELLAPESNLKSFWRCDGPDPSGLLYWDRRHLGRHEARLEALKF